jgi:hypothetical protein
VRFDGESSVAVNFNFEPTDEILTADDLATLRAVRESFSPDVHAQYHEEAVRWFRRRFPGLTPNPASIERVRDRLIIAEHFGPERQRAVQGASPRGPIAALAHQQGITINAFIVITSRDDPQRLRKDRLADLT